MKHSLLLFLSALLGLSAFSQCEEDRYRNFIFSGVDLTSDQLYGNNITNGQEEQDLFLDIYEPAGDTAALRPLVMVAHGGSFVFGSKTGTDVVPLCQDLAKMGYVTASIQYRLGIGLTFDLEQPATEAVLRGVHDSRAAVRYMRMQIEENGNPYRIDTDRIYMAGVSAGGFIALHHAYLDEESEIPEIVDQTTPGLEGGIEGTSGHAGYSSEIFGVVNIAGALVSADVMGAGDQPVCNFHGTNDGTVPYGNGTLEILGFDVREVDGSEPIAARAVELGITSCFEIQEGQDHVPHTTQVAYYDTLLSITSNFFSHLICTDVALDCDFRELDIVSSVIDYAGLSAQISSYPNPTSDRLNITGIESAMDYSIVDITGREVARGSIRPSDPAIETRELTSGIFLLRLSMDGQVVTKRFVKE